VRPRPTRPPPRRWIHVAKDIDSLARYIIDRYDSLPDNTIFIHADRFQWHNDDPDFDSVPTLRSLNISHVEAMGYVSLRCSWVVGCPVEIKPFEEDFKSEDKTAGPVYRKAFQELLLGDEVPEEVGTHCCSQFAATRDTIRRRPREDYIHFWKWLMSTRHPDGLSGRVFEYSWHSTSAPLPFFGWRNVAQADATDSYLWQASSLLPAGRRLLLQPLGPL
jgi:hypothetical protein